MASKGERFRAQAQRTGQAKKTPKNTTRKRARPRRTSGNRPPNPASHNESQRAAKNGAYELEPSTTTRPSRKSTRRSPTHLKTDSTLRITAMNRNASPQSRAQRRGGNPN
jgi:hypothetical protein